MTTKVKLNLEYRSWSCEKRLGVRGCGGRDYVQIHKRYGDEEAGEGGARRYNYHRYARHRFSWAQGLESPVTPTMLYGRGRYTAGACSRLG
jgi:hypothetical protein